MSYRIKHRKPQLRGLGDVTTLTDPTATFLSGVSTSPWLYIGGGLLLFFVVQRSFGKPKRRRRKSSGISPLTAAVFAAGAGAAVYLVNSVQNPGVLTA